jgi:hypothetical protein
LTSSESKKDKQEKKHESSRPQDSVGDPCGAQVELFDRKHFCELVPWQSWKYQADEIHPRRVLC